MPNSMDLSIKRKVLLVDDVPVVLDGLSRILNAQNDLSICGTASTLDDALKALTEVRPDVIVLALDLRDGEGQDLIKEIRSQQKNTPIVVFSKLEESAFALAVLRAGCQGFVSKKEPVEKLLDAIRTVLKGRYAVSPQISTRFLQSVLHSPGNLSVDPQDLLGEQELKVFKLLGQGSGSREIATQLEISVKTVESYRARIKEKLHLPDSPSLIREAVRWTGNRSE